MNHMITSMIVAALPFIASTAFSQVTLDPPSPKAFHDVRVKVPGTGLGTDLDSRSDSFEPRDTQVTITANKITVSPLMRGATDFGGVPTPQFEQLLGALPPGDYQLEIVKRALGRGSPGPVGGTISFTVPARDVNEPYDNYTDLWWSPSESGWGLGLFHHPSNKIFGTLYIYGSDGKPSWYVIPDGQFVSTNEYRGSIYRTTGPYYGGAFNPAQISVTAAGTAIIEFGAFDPTRAQIVFVIDGVAFNKSIQRQSF